MLACESQLDSMQSLELGRLEVPTPLRPGHLQPQLKLKQRHGFPLLDDVRLPEGLFDDSP